MLCSRGNVALRKNDRGDGAMRTLEGELAESQRRKKWRYGFERVFHPNDGQGDLWEGAAPLVQSCVGGHQVCMFAYSQMRSGKTHTMIRTTGDNRGLAPRAAERLSATKRDAEAGLRGEASGTSRSRCSRSTTRRCGTCWTKTPDPGGSP